MRAIWHQACEWQKRQKQNLDRWWRRCLPGTMVIVAAAVPGICALWLVPLPAPVQIVSAALLALAPLPLALHWAIPVPDIWLIHASRVAIFCSVIAIVTTLVGRYFAGRLLNEIYAESPEHFPVALMAGTYICSVMAMLGLILLSAILLWGAYGATKVTWDMPTAPFRRSSESVRRRFAVGWGLSCCRLTLVLSFVAAILELERLAGVVSNGWRWRPTSSPSIAVRVRTGPRT